jgi:hypothetical protein
MVEGRHDANTRGDLEKAMKKDARKIERLFQNKQTFMLP